MTSNPVYLGINERQSITTTDLYNKISSARLDILIKSNDAPSEQETRELRNQIDTRHSEFHKLDEEIKETDAELIKRRNDQQKYLTSLKATVSAIRRIPYEILARIFTFCHKSSDVKTVGLGLRLFYPLRFGQVCSRWRVVSYSTPALWSSLLICLTSKMIKASERSLELMRQWTSRAFPLPLDVEIACQSKSSLNFDLPFADRMRRLKLHVRLVHCGKLLGSAMPLLEVLDVEIPSFLKDHDEWNAPAISFEGSPRLHTVIIHSPAFLEGGMLALPWLQLTELYLNYAHPSSDVLRVLSVATNLTKFSFTPDDMYMRDPTTASAHVVHHNLRDLTIIIRCASPVVSPVMSYLLQHLTLPALKSATMGLCATTEIESFEELQARSEFTLEALGFNVASWSPIIPVRNVTDALESFLSGYTSLVKFRLGIGSNKIDPQHHEQLLKMLHAKRSLLPLVEEMHLQVSGLTVVGEWLVDMLRTRWWQGPGEMRWGVRRLRKIIVESERDFRPVIMEQLQEIEREGLVIEVNGVAPALWYEPMFY